MTPPERIEDNPAFGQQHKYSIQKDDSLSSMGVAPDAISLRKSFPENLVVLILIVFAFVLTYSFAKFMEQDISQKLHLPDRAIQIDPAGY